MAKPIALVTSASGRIGKELVALFAKEGTFTIRACCFSMEKADSLKAIGAHEVVKFDLNDSATWGTALEGVDELWQGNLWKKSEHAMNAAAELNKWLIVMTR